METPSLHLLDLFCGDGGASMGYLLAGFRVTGVDIRPTNHPPHPDYAFVQDDAFHYLCNNWFLYDAFHASPPCRPHSALRSLHPEKEYYDFIPRTRELLTDTNRPYVIENVEGAPLTNPTLLCGAMFGLRTYRHRLFETNFPLIQPYHPKHTAPSAEPGRSPAPHEFMTIAGHFANVALAREIMSMPWASRKGIANAIPPAYGEYIGSQLMHYLIYR